MYDEKPKKKKTEDGKAQSPLQIAVFIILFIIVTACAMVIILAMLGPSIGNIFSNVIENLRTPTVVP